MDQPSRIFLLFAAASIAALPARGEDAVMGPGGPAPTITISIADLQFQFFFLSGIMGFDQIRIPSSTVSIGAEDLASNAPSF